MATLLRITVTVVFISAMDFVCTHEFDYEELQKLGVSCAPKDSCLGRPPGDDPFGSTCSCDPSCSRYGSCCIDSPYLGTSEWKASCTNLYKQFKVVYMVNHCDRRSSQKRLIKSRCESDAEMFRDPISFTPVTSTASGLTYKNYFCAMCNEDYRQGVVWNVKIAVSQRYGDPQEVEKRELLSHLEYDSRNNEWGYRAFANSKRGEFVPVQISFVVPKEVQSLVNERCRTDIISECAPSWRNDETRFRCSAYMAAIYVPTGDTQDVSGTFRNAHCAMCNYVSDLSNATCVAMDARFTPYGIPGLSFSLLLDFNPSSGAKVGETDRCGGGKVYDPFYKKCRDLVCALPGYVLRSGSCVRA